MVIHMNEARLTTIEQIEAFLSASISIEFSAAGGDSERYVHISRVLTRFDYFYFVRLHFNLMLRAWRLAFYRRIPWLGAAVDACR